MCQSERSEGVHSSFNQTINWEGVLWLGKADRDWISGIWRPWQDPEQEHDMLWGKVYNVIDHVSETQILEVTVCKDQDNMWTRNKYGSSHKETMLVP